MTSPASCLVAMYHYVRDTTTTAFPDIRALSPALFEQQLDWISRDHTIVGLDAIEGAMTGERALPPNAALLTFDDGFVDHHETVLPVLRRRGLTGVFFLAFDACGPSPRVLGVHKTQFLLARLGVDRLAAAVRDACRTDLVTETSRARVAASGADRWERADERAIKDLLNHELPMAESERVLEALFEAHLGSERTFASALYLSEAMIREMAAAGMAFGYHTRTHPMLSRLTPDAQAGELRDGVGWIRDLTGQARVSFCYPWGGPRTYTPDTVRLLERAGYSVAFNTVRRTCVVTRDGRFELPRLDTRDLPPYTTGVPVDAPASPATHV